jgi:hypothetical protein
VLRLGRKLQAQGLDDGAAAAICLDFDLAVAHFGRWADGRARATREVPVSSRDKRRQTKQIPRYPTLSHQLGLALDDPQEATSRTRRGPGARTPVDPQVERQVDTLRRDPAALVDFLRLNGEA